MFLVFSMDGIYFLTCSLLGWPIPGQGTLLKARQFSEQRPKS